MHILLLFTLSKVLRTLYDVCLNTHTVCMHVQTTYVSVHSCIIICSQLSLTVVVFRRLQCSSDGLHHKWVLVQSSSGINRINLHDNFNINFVFSDMHLLIPSVHIGLIKLLVQSVKVIMHTLCLTIAMQLGTLLMTIFLITCYQSWCHI